MKGTSNADGMTTQHKLTHTTNTSSHPPSIDFIACYTPASDTLTTYEKPCQKDSFEMRLSLGRHIDRCSHSAIQLNGTNNYVKRLNRYPVVDGSFDSK